MRCTERGAGGAGAQKDAWHEMHRERRRCTERRVAERGAASTRYALLSCAAAENQCA